MRFTIDNIVSKYFWWIFSVILAFALFSHLDYLPLKFEEPRRGVVAMEMEFSGNYVTPTINGENYYNKPPIYNWILVILFKLFNSHEDWVLRIPTVLSFLLLGFINYKIVKQKLGGQVAVFSSLFFLTSTDLLFYFSFQGEIDLFYSLIVYLQIVSIFWFFEKQNYKALFLFSYFLVAIGILTKGLPSIAFQGITLFTFFIYYKRSKQLFNTWHFVGFGMFLAIVGGYFYLYGQNNDARLYMARLLTESSNRTVAEKTFLESVTHLFTFPLVLLDILAPWLLITPLFVSKSLMVKARQSQWIGFVTLFFISNIILYWVSPGSRDRYLYMFIPFITTLFAFIISGHFKDHERVPKLANGFMLVILCVLVLAMPVLPFVSPVSNIDNIFVVVSAMSLVLGALLVCYIKSSQYKIHVFVLTIVVARIGFNFIVMPLRLEDELRDNYEFHVGKILEIVQNKPFFFHGKVEHSERKLPFTSSQVSYDELAYHPFQLTYYIEKNRNEIFKFSPDKLTDRFYLSEKKFLSEQPEDKKIYYQFNLGKRGFDFVLFQYK